MSKSLTREQKEKIKSFVDLTQTGDATAQNCLTQCGWKMDIAVDNYFSNPRRYHVEEPRIQPDKKKMDQLFQKYRELDRERGAEYVLVNGILRLLEDLHLPMDSVRILIFAWKCDAKVQCEFSREEFIRGLSDLGADSLEKLSKALQTAESDLINMTKLRELYNFTYDYAKQPSQKNVDCEAAMAYWRIILNSRFALLDQWIAFLQEFNNNRSIPRDTWNLLFDFVVTVNGDCTKYDKDGAWPVVIDEFVEWVRVKSQSQTPNGTTAEAMEY